MLDRGKKHGIQQTYLPPSRCPPGYRVGIRTRTTHSRPYLELAPYKLACNLVILETTPVRIINQITILEYLGNYTGTDYISNNHTASSEWIGWEFSTQAG